MRPFKQTKGCVATLSMMASIVLALYPGKCGHPWYKRFTMLRKMLQSYPLSSTASSNCAYLFAKRDNRMTKIHCF